MGFKRYSFDWFTRVYLGLWMTPYWISFCLSPSVVIQFLECSYLFRLDNQIGMIYKLSQYHHAVSISRVWNAKMIEKVSNARLSSTTLISVDNLLIKSWLDDSRLFTTFECPVANQGKSKWRSRHSIDICLSRSILFFFNSFLSRQWCSHWCVMLKC